MTTTQALTARDFFKIGDLRQSITHFRTALLHEHDSFERAKIYLELTRIYRIKVRMKNARLELMRAFESIGVRWPKNSLISLVRSFVFQQTELSPELAKRTPIEQATILAQLYEELGLSAYYLRQNFILVQASLNSKHGCQKLGPSKPLLNWYGGTACVLALIGFKKTSQKLVEQCEWIAEKLESSADRGKALIWKALVFDYQGFPAQSAGALRTCLDTYGRTLDPFDLRLCALTLSINYFCRGHFNDALNTIEKLKKSNPCFSDERERTWLDDSFWYTLGPAAMLGQKERINLIVSNFRSILCTDKDEKWLLTQYLGHLLTVERAMGLKEFNSEEIIRRFHILKMKPKETHFESSFYWMAQAYLRFDQAKADPTLIKAFTESLKKLAQTPRHPTLQSHYAVLRVGLALLTKDRSNYKKWSAKAVTLAQSIDNRWALSELKSIWEKADA